MSRARSGEPRDSTAGDAADTPGQVGSRATLNLQGSKPGDRRLKELQCFVARLCELYTALCFRLRVRNKNQKMYRGGVNNLKAWSLILPSKLNTETRTAHS